MDSLLSVKQLDFHLQSVYCNTAKIGRYRSGQRVHFEIVYKLEGRSIQYFPSLDMTIQLIPDSIFIIPAFTSNCYEVTESGTIINIIIDLIGEKDSAGIQPELIVLPPDNAYKALFLRTAKIWKERDNSVYCRSHSLVSEILAGLIEDREKRYMERNRYAVIAPAVDYIRQHYRSPVSVKELARMCGISEEYLRQLFHSFVGQPPLRYINTLRLSYARELLLDGRMSVAQAASKRDLKMSTIFRDYSRTGTMFRPPAQIP